MDQEWDTINRNNQRGGKYHCFGFKSIIAVLCKKQTLETEPELVILV